MSSNHPSDQQSAAAGSHAPHPLFPAEQNTGTGRREIAFVTFQRRSSDGRTDNCPEDYRADEIQSWDDVVRRWGCGEYRVIGKDECHYIVACHPTRKDQWVRCDHAARPFTVRAKRPAAQPMAARPKLPRLMGTSAESIALWATLCAERAEREAAVAMLGTLDSAFLLGCATTNRRVARHILRLFAERALIREEVAP